MEKKEQIYLAALIKGISKYYKDFSFRSEIINDSSFDEILKEAESLAIGNDSDSDKMFSCGGLSKKNLVPITREIGGNNFVLNGEKWFQPQSVMDISKNYFPKSEINKASDDLALWKQFGNEFETVSKELSVLAETTLSLLYKYTTTIPSGLNNDSISVYDHIKMTAAMAVCLYEINECKENEDTPFLLIGADISGIQQYIYKIVSKFASKNLKGRSFYLRLVSDAAVRIILKRLNLFRANVIYNSGGSFYIIAPNTTETRNRLQHAIDEIENKMFDAHGTSLYLAIDSIEVPKDVITHQSKTVLGDLWHTLSQKRDKKKMSKFSDRIENNYDYFFSPERNSGQIVRDIITGDEIKDSKAKRSFADGYISKTTEEQIVLGKTLRDFDMIVVSEKEQPRLNVFHIEPLSLGLHYYFIEEKHTSLIEKDSFVNIILLNEHGLNRPLVRNDVESQNVIYTVDFYGGNEIHGNKMSTFEEMCDKMGEDAFERMGVLRMDVDNLGDIFQRGIPPEKSSFSLYTALSRAFDYFFSGYINTIWKETDPEHSFIVYSGGDDLFIVGSWEATIKIAEKIRRDFKEFTCQNPAFSISGGIAIIQPKFPLMRGAEMSNEEETNAKQHLCEKKDKNSISFMDMPLNWDMEYPQVKMLKSKIVEAIENENMPKSFISNILAHWMNAKVINHKITNIKTFWMLTYDLSRMLERTEKSNPKNLINICKVEICGNGKALGGMSIATSYHPLELWAMACRWAELELRQ